MTEHTPAPQPEAPTAPQERDVPAEETAVTDQVEQVASSDTTAAPEPVDETSQTDETARPDESAQPGQRIEAPVETAEPASESAAAEPAPEGSAETAETAEATDAGPVLDTADEPAVPVAETADDAASRPAESVTSSADQSASPAEAPEVAPEQTETAVAQTGEADTPAEVVPESADASGDPAGSPADAVAERPTPAEPAAPAEGAAPAGGTEAPALKPPAPRSVPTPAMVARAVRPAAPAVPAVPGAPVQAPATAVGQAAPLAQPEAEPTLDPAEFAAARAFGTVAADGTVSVLEAAGARVVGQFPDVSEEEALTLYIRRYLDLEAQVTLFAARLDQLSARDLDAGLQSLADALIEPAVVGDVDGLRARLEELRRLVTARKEALAAEREAARARALEERTTIVERAEALAQLDPAKVQWRADGERLRALLDEWKAAQRGGARLDRPTEDALWKRFSAARSTFDRHRRQYFAELDRRHAEVKEVKEALIARAEALSTSTDWGPTSGAMRGLMDEWKAAGRAARKEDDALWARFRAAQDTFYQARQAQNEATDAEYGANLEVKLEILAEAEKLVPVGDLKAAKAALRALQDRWEAAGRVPREHLKSTEARLRAVEQAIRDVEDAQWTRTNPRVRARAEGAAAQLEEAIAALRADVEKARAGGDQRRITRAEEALAAREAWLEQVLRAAQDAR